MTKLALVALLLSSCVATTRVTRSEPCPLPQMAFNVDYGIIIALFGSSALAFHKQHPVLGFLLLGSVGGVAASAAISSGTCRL